MQLAVLCAVVGSARFAAQVKRDGSLDLASTTGSTVNSLLDVFNTVNNLLSASDNLRAFTTISDAAKLTGDRRLDLHKLNVILDLLTENLKFTHSGCWDREDWPNGKPCDPMGDDLQHSYSFERPVLVGGGRLGATFEDANGAECVQTLKGVVQQLRYAILQLEAASKRDLARLKELVSVKVDGASCSIEASGSVRAAGGQGVVGSYKALVAQTDWAVFFGVKGAAGGFNTQTWNYCAVARLLDAVEERSAGSAFGSAARSAAASWGAVLDGYLGITSGIAVYDELQEGTWDSVGALTGLASSVSFLVKYATTFPWNNCGYVLNKLTQPELWHERLENPERWAKLENSPKVDDEQPELELTWWQRTRQVLEDMADPDAGQIF